MKLNEKFTKEEISHFEKRLTDMVSKEDTFFTFCRRLTFFRHYSLIQFLNEEYRMPKGTSHRFINYFSLSPLYLAYSTDTYKIDNTKRFIRTMWQDSSFFSAVEKKLEIELAFERNVVISRGDEDSNIKATIKKKHLFNPLFVIDENDLFWPTIILKTI